MRTPMPSTPPPAAPPYWPCCRNCGGASMTTEWHRPKLEVRTCVRVLCAACEAYNGHLAPNEFIPYPADAMRAPPRPPPANCHWAGFVRPPGDVWHFIAVATTKGRCYDALLYSTVRGEFLLVPVEPERKRMPGKEDIDPLFRGVDDAPP